MPIRTVFLVTILLCSVSIASGKDDVARRVDSVIDSLRGIDLAKLSDDERASLDDRLDAAWEVLLEAPSVSKQAVRRILAEEQEDSFLIIDLAYLLLVLDSDLLAESAAALEKADPNAYPGGYFKVAAGMAASHCATCLPAVMGMLELKELNTGITEHALPVGIDLGLVFTVGQFGDTALPGVLTALDSDDCVVRGNAALAVSYLLPVAEPAQLAQIALDDPCEPSRSKAWAALGALASPSLGTQAARRLASDKAPSADELEAIIAGLALAATPEALQQLKSLSSAADGRVAEAAAEALAEIDKNSPTPAELRAVAGTGSQAARSRMQRELKRAVRKGRLGTEVKRTELLAALTPDDVALLNEARAAVLNRVSDECLYEYFDMTAAVRILRAMSSSLGAQPEAAGNEPPAN